MLDDRDVVALYVAEMRALLPLVQRHLGTLGGDAGPEEQAVARRETIRLATAMADLSSGFHAEDCAQLTHALAVAVEREAAEHARVRLSAAGADALTYVQFRVNAMAAQSRVFAADESERAWCQRLVAGLESAGIARDVVALPSIAADSLATSEAAWTAEAPGEDERRTDEPLYPAIRPQGRITRPIADPFFVDDSMYGSPIPAAAGESLTEDEIALLRSFHMSPLRLSPNIVSPQVEAASRQSAVPDVPTAVEVETAPEEDTNDGQVGTLSEKANTPVQPRAPTDDELDAIPPEMKRIFIVETASDLEELRRALVALEEHPEDGEPLLVMSRIAHKIRGTAGTLTFDTLARVAFIFEDLLRAILSKQVAAGATSTTTLVRCLMVLQDALQAAQTASEPEPSLLTQAEAIQAELLTGGPAGQDAAAAPTGMSVPLVPPAGETPASAPMTRPFPPVDGESSVKVDVRRLDELMTRVSDLALNRAALTQARKEAVRVQDEMDRSLARLAEISGHIVLADPAVWGGEASHGPSNMLTARNGSPFAPGIPLGTASPAASMPVGDAAGRVRWDELELIRQDELDHAVRVLSEVVSDLTTTSRTLRSALARISHLSQEQAGIATRVQQNVMQVRLVPLEELVPRLRVEARGLAVQVGKKVALSVSGELTQIDRNISEALADPLLQLVRNAIIHGLETPEERRELGKPETGSIRMDASYVGSEVIIEIGDDGRGINPHALVASAISLGYLDPQAARSLSPQDALDLMFLPRVTGLGRAQVVGGRGIGLDDVRSKVEALKGDIHVRNSVGQSTVFRIRVPISLSVVRAMIVSAATQRYAIPFSSVLRTVTLSPSDIFPPPAAWSQGAGQPAGARQAIRIESAGGSRGESSLGQQEIALVSLAELLGLGYERPIRESQLAVIVDLGHHRLALAIDDVHGDPEVVVKALPKHLRRRAVRGATVTPGGEVLLLLDVPQLVAQVFDHVQAPRSLRPRPTPALARTLAPRVLIVDDSISIRRSLELALTRAGFDVQLAADGIEALELMLADLPHVVVLDIEMPRLDGFELLSILRGSPQFRAVRVAMLTSRATDKHRAYALELGASAYLVKPCPNETLVETIHGLIAEPARIS